MKRRDIGRVGILSATALALAACGETETSTSGTTTTSAPAQQAPAQKAAPSGPAPIIAIDGSSTVFPITEAVAEEFQKINRARITVGVSGTGGGFKKFCNNETVISDASRPIKSSEVTLCGEKSIEFIELPVAFDGLAVVVNPKNTWVDHLTTAELKKIWEPAAQGKVLKWSDVRPGFPDKPLTLFAPGVDSGTFDYFTEAINGESQASRGDFTPSEDDNVLVQGITTDENALGYFGFAYYVENQDKLKVVPIDDGNEDNGQGAIAPSLVTVGNGTYQPLARPIFIYVSKSGADRPEVQAFVEFYLTQGRPLVEEVGYIRLPDKAYDLALERFNQRVVTGTVFSGGAEVGVTIEELLSRR